MKLISSKKIINWLLIIAVVIVIQLVLWFYQDHIFAFTLDTNNGLKITKFLVPFFSLVACIGIIFFFIRKYNYNHTLMLSWIDYNQDAIVCVDTNYKIIFLNQTFKDYYPAITFKEEDNLLALLPVRTISDWRVAITKALQGEEAVLENSEYLKKIVFAPLKNLQEKILGVSIVIKLSSFVEEEKVRELLEEAQQKNEELQAQEDELQKNLEELADAQDEMLKLQEELKDREANLAAILDSTEDIMYSIDFKYKLLSMNKAFIEYYDAQGIKVKKGMNILKIFPASLLDQRKTYINRTLEGDKFTVVEKSNITHEEGNFYEISYNPIKNQEDIIIGVAIFTKNITNRIKIEEEKQRLIDELKENTNQLKTQEESLTQSLAELKTTQEELVEKNNQLIEKEARLRSVIDNTHDAIFAIDLNYSITILNKTVQNPATFGGIGLDTGYSIFTMIPPEQIPHWKANCDRAINGDAFTVLDKINNKFYEVSFNPILDDKIKVIGVSILARDINKHIETNEENVKTINILKKIQEREQTVNSEKELEIDEYRKKLEMLKSESITNKSDKENLG